MQYQIWSLHLLRPATAKSSDLDFDLCILHILQPRFLLYRNFLCQLIPRLSIVLIIVESTSDCRALIVFWKAVILPCPPLAEDSDQYAGCCQTDEGRVGIERGCWGSNSLTSTTPSFMFMPRNVLSTCSPLNSSRAVLRSLMRSTLIIPSGDEHGPREYFS